MPTGARLNASLRVINSRQLNCRELIRLGKKSQVQGQNLISSRINADTRRFVILQVTGFRLFAQSPLRLFDGFTVFPLIRFFCVHLRAIRSFKGSRISLRLCVFASLRLCVISRFYELPPLRLFDGVTVSPLIRFFCVHLRAHRVYRFLRFFAFSHLRLFVLKPPVKKLTCKLNFYDVYYQWVYTSR